MIELDIDIDPETKKAVAVCLSMVLLLASPAGLVLADETTMDGVVGSQVALPEDFGKFESENTDYWEWGQSGFSVTIDSAYAQQGDGYAESDPNNLGSGGEQQMKSNQKPVVKNLSEWEAVIYFTQPGTISGGDDNKFVWALQNDSMNNDQSLININAGSQYNNNNIETITISGEAVTNVVMHENVIPSGNDEWDKFRLNVTDGNVDLYMNGTLIGEAEIKTAYQDIDTSNTVFALVHDNYGDEPDNTYRWDNMSVTRGAWFDTYSVSGTVWNDSDDDGINDSGESGLDGVTVEVIDSNGDVVNSGTTDANGDYSISGIRNGTYSVEFSGASGYEDDTYDVVNVDGGDVTGIDVGLAPVTAISGTVTDGDTDEAIADATITVYNSTDAVENTTTTDSNGNYTVKVPGGTYTVEANATGYENASVTVTVDETALSGIDFELEPQPEEELEIDTKRFIEHGEAVPYTAEIVTYDGDGNKVDAINVTGDSANLTVTSNNTTALTVDDVGYQLVATSDDSVNVVVNVTAEFDNATYSNLSVSKDVTVASLEMSNLKIIPGVYRISAIFGTGGSGEDAANQTDTLVLLIAILSGVVGARWTTVFGGISFMVLTILIGWFGGWVSLGLVFVTVFVGAFLGLNVAVNIDYEVRPG